MSRYCFPDSCYETHCEDKWRKVDLSGLKKCSKEVYHKSGACSIRAGIFLTTMSRYCFPDSCYETHCEDKSRKVDLSGLKKCSKEVYHKSGACSIRADIFLNLLQNISQVIENVQRRIVGIFVVFAIYSCFTVMRMGIVGQINLRNNPISFAW